MVRYSSGGIFCRNGRTRSYAAAATSGEGAAGSFGAAGEEDTAEATGEGTGADVAMAASWELRVTRRNADPRLAGSIVQPLSCNSTTAVQTGHGFDASSRQEGAGSPSTTNRFAWGG